ncbi:hypothetical protein [Bordetella avium]|uniref:Uncharacterized protein n=1 Tax=Bordetella avium (strain 197N) TaxID=360910 RepID=Q2KW01_BORA1|nr:hypothetical protein [Bordetella avium]AZY51004.1 hypothetical protein C0J09_14170 [Bordetella avium]AZY53538.1 hypothetical protein C0J07_14420 [Bordetella avium]RIQ11871.1 hypothetical protein D0432_15395 [Bordetella avium]RIQ16299.1 hypothetical protein D0850_15310 [Bordetella avium]RIQ33939.1 hypothetical protein D0849_10135 [Bordetella avium]
MRFFDLFLRRAGVDRSVTRRQGVSRLTVVCPRDALGDVRKQICLDFSAAGLSVAHFQVDSSQSAELASACVTVNCPPELRGELMSQAKRLSANPSVRQVRFGAAATASAR